jgi:hypothetical protein
MVTLPPEFSASPLLIKKLLPPKEEAELPDRAEISPLYKLSPVDRTKEPEWDVDDDPLDI